MLPNDNVSMSVGHLDHVLIVYSSMECKPKFWKRYVDDVLELIKKDQVRNLTDHINIIDPTGNIKLTYIRRRGGQADPILGHSSSPTGKWVSETSGL